MGAISGYERDMRISKVQALLAAAEADVTFVGRLAQYRYYNMDQCVGAALAAASKVLERMDVAAIEPT